MIVVACDACGVRLKAKDEYSGRTMKCPKCGEPITVPGGDGEKEPPPPVVRPSAPAVASTRAARPSRRRRKGGTGSGDTPHRTHARRPAGASGTPRIAIVLAVISSAALIVWVATIVFGDSDLSRAYGAGVDLLKAGHFDEAIEEFSRIPEGHNLYAMAQSQIKSARELKVVADVRTDAKFSANLYGIIMQLREDWVDEGGEGYLRPTYAPNARYMLKRAREFLDLYPDDERAAEVKDLFRIYQKVASLDVPPTEEDVRAEIGFRMQARRWDLALTAVDEFAVDPENAETADAIRAEIAMDARNTWKAISAQIEQKYLQPGAEQWQRVVNESRKFIDGTEGMPAVQRDAWALHDRAYAAAGG